MKDIEIIDLILAHKDTESKIGISEHQIFFSYAKVINEDIRTFIEGFKRRWYYNPTDRFIYISRKEA